MVEAGGIVLLLVAAGLVVWERECAERIIDRFEPRAGAMEGAISLPGINLSFDRGEGTLGYQYEEWVVRAGQRVYLLGEASDGSGQLVVGRPSEGPYILSTRSEQELARNLRGQQRFARIALAVATVAGVVLLVVGLLT